MSKVLAFYRGEATDAAGRRLTDLWGWNDQALEEVHDFIQWLFPLPEPSQFNYRAPLLTEEDIAAFRVEERLRANLHQSFCRLLKFLGLSRGEDGKVVEGPNFAARAPEVWASWNHNWLRITRILRSLRLLELEAESRALFAWLEEVYRGHRFPIPADTFQFWTEAVEGLPFHA
jgi:hypothetical protein